MPALIAAAGDVAGWHYVEFFAANVANDHTRRLTSAHAAYFSLGGQVRRLHGRNQLADAERLS